MAEMADKVYYVPMYEADVNVADSIEVLREKPVSVEGSLKVQELVTDRNRYDVDGVFFLRESVSPAQLVQGLKIEVNHIAVVLPVATRSVHRTSISSLQERAM